MAKVKALCSFSGAVSMGVGETKEISDKNIVADLVSAGYVVEIKEKPKKEKENEN